MPELTKNPTLKNFQQYVAELETERGFSHQTIIDKCLLLGEEVGELFKAVRKSEGLAVDTNSNLRKLATNLRTFSFTSVPLPTGKELTWKQHS